MADPQDRKPDDRKPNDRRHGAAAAVWTGGARGLGDAAAAGLTHLRSFFDVRTAAMAEADDRRLFLWLPVAMGVGVALFFAADGVPSPWPAVVMAAVCGAGAWRVRARLASFALLVGLAFLFAGFAAAAVRTIQAAGPVLDRPVFAQLTGYVETVDAGPGGGRMVLAVTSFQTAFPVTAPQRLRVRFKEGAPRAGDHISGRARLLPPPQPAFPGGYDFARDAYFLGLGAVGSWTGPMPLAPPSVAASLALRVTAAIDNARTDMTNRIARFIGGQAGALSAALVTGKRGLIDEPVNDAMRAAGIYHIVSISGLHMVLAAGVFFWLARALLALLPTVAERQPIKKWAALIAMAGATAYCIFSGSEVATERSLIMTLTMLMAVLFDRPALSMRNLAISALIVLAREPETMLGPSFQMSFAAVAGMIAAHEWWLSRRSQRPEPAGWGGIFLRKLWMAALASMATTLIASVATAPFAAYHFQRLNPYGLIGNALAVPFVSFIVMPAAVAGTLLMPFGLDGIVWQLMGLGSERVIEVARYVAAFAGSVRGVQAFPLTLLCLMAAGGIVLMLIRAPIRLLGAGLMLAATILAARITPPDVFVDREGRVAAFRAVDGRMALLGRGTSRFVLDRWLAADGDLRKANDPSLRQVARCDRMGCVGRLADGTVIALVLEADALEEDCRRAKLVITPLVAPAFCAVTTTVIDRALLQTVASLAVRHGPEGFHLAPARPVEQWKPWYGRPRETPPPANASSASANPNEAFTPETAPPQDDAGDLLIP